MGLALGAPGGSGDCDRMLFADCDRIRLMLGDGCSSASNEGSVCHASTALSVMALLVLQRSTSQGTQVKLCTYTIGSPWRFLARCGARVAALQCSTRISSPGANLELPVCMRALTSVTSTTGCTLTFGPDAVMRSHELIADLARCLRLANVDSRPKKTGRINKKTLLRSCTATRARARRALTWPSYSPW